jgi:hypothetical protein
MRYLPGDFCADITQTSCRNNGPISHFPGPFAGRATAGFRPERLDELSTPWQGRATANLAARPDAEPDEQAVIVGLTVEAINHTARGTGWLCTAMLIIM